MAEIKSNGELMVFTQINGVLSGKGKIITQKQVMDCEIVGKEMLIKTPSFSFQGQYMAGFVHGRYQSEEYDFNGYFKDNIPFKGDFVIKSSSVLDLLCELISNFIPNVSPPSSLSFSAQIDNMHFVLPIKSQQFYIDSEQITFEHTNYTLKVHPSTPIYFSIINQAQALTASNIQYFDRAQYTFSFTNNTLTLQQNNNKLTLVNNNATIIFESGDKFKGTINPVDFKFSPTVFVEGLFVQNEQKQSGQFQNGVLHGQGVIMNSTGTRQGIFQNGVHVEGVFQRIDGVVFEIE
ncbi:Conserved_hypothetical protein [Hexamita inflata]|uniref:Uncharacterized protein n=1 Tax=Hexamita inflata TaxID=28002 RepID=A0AA86UV76_9EUKA|nr:Conserved hypothetical protein [Hexamita inflata]